MKIIIKDEVSGKQYLIKGHDLDWEIFKQSKGKVVDGKEKGKGEWTTCRSYPTTLPYAVDKVINWLLADKEDETKISTSVLKAGLNIKKAIDKRIDEIVVEVQQND